MDDIRQKAEPALKKLLGADEHTLFEQLGMRERAAKEGSERASHFNPIFVHDVKEMGPLDDLRDLGRRLLRRWTRELYTVACGSAEKDKADRESIIKSLGLGDIAVGGAITAVLIGTFAVTPAVATVIAALIVKRIIEPAGETVCEFWGEKLAED